MSKEVPLADIADEWNEFIDHQNVNESPAHLNGCKTQDCHIIHKDLTIVDSNDNDDHIDDEEDLKSYAESELPIEPSEKDKEEKLICDSIQELVNNFDEQIINCFTDYDQPIEQLAPVQILNQEELINECHSQMSNLKRKDAKTGRKMSEHSTDDERSLPFTAEQVLNEIDALMQEEEEEAQTPAEAQEINHHHQQQTQTKLNANYQAEHLHLKQQLMNQNLILNGSQTIDDHLQSELHLLTSLTDDQCKSINDQSMIAMQNSLIADSECSTLDSGLPECSRTSMTDSLCLPSTDAATTCMSASLSSMSLCSESPFVRTPLAAGIPCSSMDATNAHHLQQLSICQLNELYLDLERAIQQLSEALIQELAVRDELEYEKEQKNTFISLLLSIQAKRRKQNLQRKGSGRLVEAGKHLSTVIPYPADSGPPDLPTLQILIKILKAINDDSPAVPTLLTDFILKVLCAT